MTSAGADAAPTVAEAWSLGPRPRCHVRLVPMTRERGPRLVQDA
jgi:hypothetical protein